jgi:hypothetical protein
LFGVVLVPQSKKNIPRGMVACVLTLFGTAILIFICVALSPPGLEADAAVLFPFSDTFAKVMIWIAVEHQVT